MYSSVKSKVTLWEECGEKFDPYLYKTESDPYIIIVTSTTLKEFRGEITFATTCASKIYVNLKIDYINSLKEKYSNKSVGVETLQSANVETLPIEEQMFQNRMSICELLESEWSIDIQECIVTVRAKITKIDNSFDWYYISCNFCRKKIKPANGVYTCPTCTTDCKFPLMRFKIHICVADKTGGTTLVLFNAIAEKLLDTSAHKLVNRLASGDNGIPSQIENLCGKEFVFKLKLNSYNLKDGLENFTVIKHFPLDEELELQHALAKEKKGKNIVDDVDEPENQKAEGFNKGKKHASANDFDDVVEDDLDSDGVTSTNQPSTSTKLRRLKKTQEPSTPSLDKLEEWKEDQHAAEGVTRWTRRSSIRTIWKRRFLDDDD
ncbi:uncharacterized protein LOC132619582 [Lycium barbarum]|uniref:uncharacterized protein LOC132619582 n=1 Tax=Lycium barbarum TaxID=112863 RepID=UPI00293E54FB|nr:uncharacterized protein LOC132619582 [Lycium barbarum]